MNLWTSGEMLLAVDTAGVTMADAVPAKDATVDGVTAGNETVRGGKVATGASADATACGVAARLASAATLGFAIVALATVAAALNPLAPVFGVVAAALAGLAAFAERAVWVAESAALILLMGYSSSIDRRAFSHHRLPYIGAILRTHALRQLQMKEVFARLSLRLTGPWTEIYLIK
jgi:hypothetical protein